MEAEAAQRAGFLKKYNYYAYQEALSFVWAGTAIVDVRAAF
jgi:hypothetical protein